MVRAFAHGVMGCWIDSSWWTQLSVADLSWAGLGVAPWLEHSLMVR